MSGGYNIRRVCAQRRVSGWFFLAGRSILKGQIFLNERASLIFIEIKRQRVEKVYIIIFTRFGKSTRLFPVYNT